MRPSIGAARPNGYESSSADYRKEDLREIRRCKARWWVPFWMRFISGSQSPPLDYVVTSVELAQEYVNLGKLGKAGTIYHNVTNLATKIPLSDETRLLLSLRYAECQAAAGNILKASVYLVYPQMKTNTTDSSSAYCEAYAASENLPAVDNSLPSAQRIVMHAANLERAAVAASTFSLIQYSRVRCIPFLIVILFSIVRTTLLPLLTGCCNLSGCGIGPSMPCLKSHRLQP